MVTTANGAITNATSGNAVLDLFSIIGSARNMDKNELNKMFDLAFHTNPDLAVRVLLWARDIRGGAGERNVPRHLIRHLIDKNPEIASKILPLIPVFGRWDDLFVYLYTPLESKAIDLIATALDEKNALCAKWLPRKGIFAYRIRSGLGLSPKRYRKLIVRLSNTVEQKMSAKMWDKINYSHVPSVAMARYKQAFNRNDFDRYQDFLEAVKNGNTKINASAVFPHDIVRDMSDKQATDLQWKALPDYIPDGVNILPVIDVSGSMGSMTPDCPLGRAVSLGVYCSQRIKGDLKNAFITFSSTPELCYLKGDNIVDIMSDVQRANWGMTTNFQSVFDLILNSNADIGIDYVVVLSDMEFNCCGDKSNFDKIKERFEAAGKVMPKLIFWNLKGRSGNNPVTVLDNGTSMISGFSPAVMKFVFGGEYQSPYETMLDVINVERYNWNV